MFYFDPLVQQSMQKELKRVMGKENKEDAMQEAYLAIADENPLTIEDACNCSERAIHRFRNNLMKISRHEERDQDSWYGNTESCYDSDDTDDEGHTQAWWDFVAPRTPVFSKSDRERLKRDIG